jgi:hypothetical protein
MSDNNEKFQGRTPGRKLSREDLSKTVGGKILIPGCGTQGCIREPEQPWPVSPDKSTR